MSVEHIRKFLAEHNLNQSQLAQKIGISRQMISAVMRRKCEPSKRIKAFIENYNDASV